MKDETPNPPQYSANSGFLIRAQAHGGSFTTTPTLSSYVASIGINAPHAINAQVTMGATNQAEHYAGHYNPAFPSVRLFTGCGLRLYHRVDSKWLGIWPWHRDVTASVPGNPYAQAVEVNGLDVAFPNGGGSVTTAKTGVVGSTSTDMYVSLVNGYDKVLTVSKAEVTCGGQTCGSRASMYIVAITLPAMPTNLACGEYVTVAFSCTDEAVTQSLPVEVTFATDLGTVIHPFYCVPNPGG